MALVENGRHASYGETMTTEQNASPRDHTQRQAALRDLQTLRHDAGEPIPSALSLAAQRAAEHFKGNDPGNGEEISDRVEIWGKRIGRALSLVAFVGLTIYLYVTYIR